jgi:integrase
VDFANGTLFINRAKGNKDRLIPIDETLTDILRAYSDSMFKDGQADSYLSVGNDKKGRSLRASCSPSWAQKNFRVILEEAGIDLLKVLDGERNICLYCLRHTFAINSFRKQDIKDVDDSRVTPLLSIYMGHEKLKGTEKYIHMTAESSEDILALTAAYSKSLFPGVPREK